jgi:hypothetical protein
MFFMSDVDAPENKVLLTSDQVRGWQEELQRWEAKRKEAERCIDALNRKLAATAFLSGITFSSPVVAGEGTMGDAIARKVPRRRHTPH